MTLLEIIGMVGVAAVFFIIGIIVELCIDAKTITDLQEKNRKLELENSQLKDKRPVKVVKIVDNTVGAKIDFPNSTGPHLPMEFK